MRERCTACAVEQSVSDLDGVVDCVCASSFIDFPQAEAYLRHLMASVELDIWRSHC